MIKRPKSDLKRNVNKTRYLINSVKEDIIRISICKMSLNLHYKLKFSINNQLISEDKI